MTPLPSSLAECVSLIGLQDPRIDREIQIKKQQAKNEKINRKYFLAHSGWSFWQGHLMIPTPFPVAGDRPLLLAQNHLGESAVTFA
jgi:hypothetical protein